MTHQAPAFQALLSVWLVLPSVSLAADTLKGLVECMNHEDCLGANRICSHDFHNDVHYRKLQGKCVCSDGFMQDEDSFACVKKAMTTPRSPHVTCETDEDCNRNEVCMSWNYDPSLEYARKLRTRLSIGDKPETHQFCIDAWIIYNNHLEDLDEPRTGGGLRSSRRNYEAEEYLFGGRRPPRVHQQYIGFAEDVMLILFLLCILATLVTVHRAACYRQIQDARRNTPLRHLLPIAEDRPPPYIHRSPDSADGLTTVVCASPAPKPLSETPPPTYAEALYRQAVRMPELGQEVQVERDGEHLDSSLQGGPVENIEEVIMETVIDDQSVESSIPQIDASELTELIVEENTNTEDIIESIEVIEDTEVVSEPDERGKLIENSEDCVVAKNENSESVETPDVVNA